MSEPIYLIGSKKHLTPRTSRALHAQPNQSPAAPPPSSPLGSPHGAHPESVVQRIEAPYQADMPPFVAAGLLRGGFAAQSETNESRFMAQYHSDRSPPSTRAPAPTARSPPRPGGALQPSDLLPLASSSALPHSSPAPSLPLSAVPPLSQDISPPHAGSTQRSHPRSATSASVVLTNAMSPPNPLARTPAVPLPQTRSSEPARPHPTARMGHSQLTMGDQAPAALSLALAASLSAASGVGAQRTGGGEPPPTSRTSCRSSSWAAGSLGLSPPLFRRAGGPALYPGGVGGGFGGIRTFSGWNPSNAQTAATRARRAEQAQKKKQPEPCLGGAMGWQSSTTRRPQTAPSSGASGSRGRRGMRDGLLGGRRRPRHPGFNSPAASHRPTRCVQTEHTFPCAASTSTLLKSGDLVGSTTPYPLSHQQACHLPQRPTATANDTSEAPTPAAASNARLAPPLSRSAVLLHASSSSSSSSLGEREWSLRPFHLQPGDDTHEVLADHLAVAASSSPLDLMSPLGATTTTLLPQGEACPSGAQQRRQAVCPAARRGEEDGGKSPLAVPALDTDMPPPPTQAVSPTAANALVSDPFPSVVSAPTTAYGSTESLPIPSARDEGGGGEEAPHLELRAAPPPSRRSRSNNSSRLLLAMAAPPRAQRSLLKGGRRVVPLSGYISPIIPPPKFAEPDEEEQIFTRTLNPDGSLRVPDDGTVSHAIGELSQVIAAVQDKGEGLRESLAGSRRRHCRRKGGTRRRHPLLSQSQGATLPLADDAVRQSHDTWSEVSVASEASSSQMAHEGLLSRQVQEIRALRATPSVDAETARKELLFRSYESILAELRSEESALLDRRRGAEFERVRPARAHWWELTGPKWSGEHTRFMRSVRPSVADLEAAAYAEELLHP